MNGNQNSATPPTGWQFNPGDTVTPATSAQPPSAAGQATQGPAQEAVLPPDTSLAGANTDSDALAAENSTSDTVAPVASDGQITWTASEYVAHHKTAMWYVSLTIVAVVAAGVAYLATRDIITAVSIILIAFVFGLSAGRKPRVLEYSLDSRGLRIAQKTYTYGSFRSFAVIDEGAFSSIVFIPLKRFMPILTIYYAPEDENQIIQIIADHLPMEQRKRDAIDTLLHKIRF